MTVLLLQLYSKQYIRHNLSHISDVRYLIIIIMYVYYFNQNVIKKVTKVLIKKSIYPTQEEFYDATNEFLNENHEDFIMKYSKRKWSTVYEKYFYKPVS